MKKHLIAAAVATAVTSPAMSQVTLSGYIDLSPHSTQTITVGNDSVKTTGTGNHFTTGASGSNRINFNVTEDLGGGLKADALYRFRFNRGDGQGAQTADDMWIRLSSANVGSVRLGRYSPFVDNIGGLTGAFSNANTVGTVGSANMDLVAGTMSSNASVLDVAGAAAADGLGTLAKAAQGAGNYSDVQGNLQYVSPSINGFVITLDYAKGTADTSTVAGRAAVTQTGYGLTYATGPLTLNLAYAARETNGTILAIAPAATAGLIEAAGSVKGTIKWAAVGYDARVARFYVTHVQREDDNVNGVRTDDLSVNTVGIQIPMGAVTLFASMFDGSDKNQGIAGNAANENRDVKGSQIAASYALSKRTSAYLTTGTQKDTGATAANNFKQTQTSLGIAHSF